MVRRRRHLLRSDLDAIEGHRDRVVHNRVAPWSYHDAARTWDRVVAAAPYVVSAADTYRLAAQQLADDTVASLPLAREGRLMFSEITGDVFDPAHGFDAVGHGVNLKGVMGAGIAKTVSTRYPAIMEPYRRACSTGELALGGHQVWQTPDGLFIVNLATQSDLGRDARLWAVADSVRSALDDLADRGVRRFGVPQLGAGIGGLDWADVRDVLSSIGHERDHIELIAVTYDR